MIKIIANSFLQDGAYEKVEAFLQEMVAETRKEAGCVSYELLRDKEDQNHLTFVETWESEEAIQLHFNSSHFQALIPKISAFCVKPLEVGKFDLLI